MALSGSSLGGHDKLKYFFELRGLALLRFETVVIYLLARLPGHI